MAATQFLCQSLYLSFKNGQKPNNLCKRSSFSPSSGHGSCLFNQKPQNQRYPVVRASASESAGGRKQVEIVYDLDEKINRLADEVDINAGLQRLSLFSPCKINVFLRITRKREDGFHDLASLFHVISLGDTIKFSLSPTKTRDRMSTNVPGVPLDERNLTLDLGLRNEMVPYLDSYLQIQMDSDKLTLEMREAHRTVGRTLRVATIRHGMWQFGGNWLYPVLSSSFCSVKLENNSLLFGSQNSHLHLFLRKIIKALNLYREKTGSDNFFWIHLDKKVPTGAGLGGGSSNAATALWAANQFNGGIATEQELQEWSAEIGSDIPFFFSHGAAYCTSRGEVVQDIPPPIPLDLPMVLIKPPEACPTAEVYKRFRLDQTSSVNPLTLLEKIKQAGISQDVCINDLEPPAFEVLPSLKRLKQRIHAAGRGRYDAVFMSGSGSTIVGLGSPDPPQFVYDEDDYRDVFVSEAHFLTRGENQWYAEPGSTFSSSDSPVTDRLSI